MANFTKEQRDYIETKFKEVDTDNSGSITKKELLVLIKSLGGGEISTEITLSQFDDNEDGKLTFDEFLKFAPTVGDWNLPI
ncbi:hypothetical protein BGZ93_000294 [Podila epicladia]|nr:hypothetical protein BGZ92_005598 [Podila epicladia]KAG0086122.1 hypothetical protein BGZ93_000294 [Podila epicladia]